MEVTERSYVIMIYYHLKYEQILILNLDVNM